MSDFGKFSDYNKDANFSMVKFGGGVKIIEAELNEAQQIIIGKLKDLITHQIGEGVYLDNNMTYNGGTFTIGDTFAVVGGNLIYISSLSISATDGQDIYLDIHEDELAFGDTLNRYGNEQETEIDNKILDMRLGTETTRRMGVKYNLSTSNGVAGHTYLKLGSISGSVFTSSVKTLTTNDNIQQNIDIARDIAKQYTDSQIATVTSTGIPKLVSYPYDLYATTDNQTVFEIPYDYFTNATDTLMVFFDGIFRPTTDYVITNPIEVEGVITKGYITLSVGRPIDSYVGLMILKNVPIGEDGSIRGGVIAVDSLPQDRVTGLVETLNNLSTFNTTTDGRLDDIEGELLDATITTPTISYGMNSKITNTGKTSVSPKFTIQGKTVINLLGKDGNCEDVSKFSVGVGTLGTFALDSTVKLFGTNSIKITSSATSVYKGIPISLTSGKYYCASVYVKSSNAIENGKIAVRKSDASYITPSSAILDTTFTRSFIKFLSDGTETSAGIYENQVSNGYINYDGLMLEEITQAQYNDSNFTPSPYVDSYSCLQNPYIEIRHDNLVRNGNGEEGVAWWTPISSADSISIVNGKIRFTGTTIWSGANSANIPVKPNTNYYLKFNKTGGDIYINPIDSYTSLTSGGNTSFNTGSNTSIRVTLSCAGTIGAYDFDSIMLIEGTTPPTEYKPCRIERTVIEGKFTSDDSLTYDNGEVSGLINWKHRTLFGKDYDWKHNADYTGVKNVRLDNAISGMSNSVINNYPTKYNGDVLKVGNSDIANVVEMYYLDSVQTRIKIGLADTDTGWSESIAPNNDEVKAFMNGWKAISNNGTRYIAWVSVIDGSIPSGAVQTATTGTSASGQAVLNVSSSTGFVTGDTVIIYKIGVGAYYGTISSLTSTTITLTGNLSITFDNTWIVIRCDNGSTNTALLNYCKNNVAPGYEGYQLHYKLANPEPITDVNTSIQGDIPKFDIGDNYLYLDSGIVLGEVANPVNSGDGYYRINSLMYSIDLPSIFKNKDERIDTVYKNRIFDNQSWTFNDSSAYGKQKLFIPIANFDINATYTVDYKILATQAPQIGSIGCSYSQDIASAIIDLNEKVESRQVKDSALDTLVDLSVYERIVNTSSLYPNWYHGGNYFYLRLVLPFSVVKKTIPKITINSLIRIYYGTGTGSDIEVTSKFLLTSLYVSKSDLHVLLMTTDATTISNMKTNGSKITNLDIIADCRDRI